MLPCQIAVAATYNAEPLDRAFRFWKSIGVPVEAVFAPYNQVFQQLVDPAALFRANAAGVNVVLLRFSDWWDGEGVADRQVRRTLTDFARAARSAASGGASLLVVRCPDPPALAEDPAWAAPSWEAALLAELARAPGIHVTTAGELEALYPVHDYHSEQGERLGHVPYSAAFFAALATAVVRRVYAITASPCKVIVLDGDHTLWDGICGEDGPAGVRLTPPYEALQRFMLAQSEAGRLLCLASKNVEEDVRAVFAHHPEMPLALSHFAATRIGWEPKSAGIREMAKELGLGLDAFAFVDDSAVECAEVRAHCPEVLTLQLPPDPLAIPRFLRNVWAFDVGDTTEEDAQRASRYRDQARREQAREVAPSFASFLADLQLEIGVHPLAPADVDRAAQLTQRTNQFNASGQRRSAAEVASWLEKPHHGGAATTVRDRFGDYGTVGLVLHHVEGDALVLDSFLLSCRALGRGVEHRLLREMGCLARDSHLRRVEIPFHPTAKNEPVLGFLRSVAQAAGDGDGPRRFTIDAIAAANLTFDPGRVRQDRAPARRPAEADVSPPPTSALPGWSAILARIATELTDTPSLLAAMAAPGAAPLAPAGINADGPRTPTERTIAGIWATTLNTAPPGREDHFFDCGGDSLDATLLLAYVHKAYGVSLPLQALFDAPTVAGLARTVQLNLVAQAGAERIAAALRELEAMRQPVPVIPDLQPAAATRRRAADNRIDTKENGAAHA